MKIENSIAIIFIITWVTYSSCINNPTSNRGIRDITVSPVKDLPQETLEQRIKQRIKRNEGFSNKVYVDSLGNAIIGYGHKLRPDEYSPTGIEEKTSQEHLHNTSYSFTDEPFIHPNMIDDFRESLSGEGKPLKKINLFEAKDNKRYQGEIKIRPLPDKHPYVFVEDGTWEFGYQYVGQTTTGVHVILTSSWGGGSGIFKYLMFLRFEHNLDNKDRIVLKRLGETRLGDRWDGELRVEGNDLFIGRDEGWFTIDIGIISTY